MNSQLIGGVLLIIGTSIGGGLLALPIATAQLGFIPAFLLLILCWAIMTTSALLILEVNLWYPMNSNLVTMAKKTLGRFGQIIAWTSYLLLLYALLAAYIAGGSDFLQHLLSGLHVSLSIKMSTLLFAGLLSLIVCLGIRSVDYINRGLMLSKMASYILLVLCIFPFVSTHFLLTPVPEKKHFPTAIIGSVPIIMTSFGFAIIVPSLRSYFNNDAMALRKAILIGSLIPLSCYIVWESVIMGVIPLQGSTSLLSIAHSDHATGDLITALSHQLHNASINLLSKIFTSICLATSFLGAALSLFDFLNDGLALKKQGIHRLILYAMTFLPPLFIASYCPFIFIKALSYAGVLCTLLLILLPAMMAWSGRYNKGIALGYQVAGGKGLLISLIVTALLIISLNLIS